jgi:hypothetical protein
MDVFDLDLFFGGAVVILMSLSFIGMVYIIVDDTNKYKQKKEYEKNKNTKKQ